MFDNEDERVDDTKVEAQEVGKGPNDNEEEE